MAIISAFKLFTLITIATISEARVTAQHTVHARAAIANGVSLRILPIGDSITFGAPVEPFNGYRKELLDKLVSRGNTVDYVGSTASGTFSNNQHEGHRGKIIDEIAQESSVGIWAAPNIVLIHAGTNDINRDIDVNNAPDRLSNLIELIYEHSPNAAVFVAQIVPTKTASSTARVKAYNNAIPGVVNTWVTKGKHIMTVDIFNAVNSATDLADDLHPNFQGYTKMAQQWYDAITTADAKGWIVEAGTSQTPPLSAGSNCGANGEWKSRGEIATGPHAAYADNPFVQEWEPPITFSTHECDPSRLFFPDLDGDGYGDWACVGDIGDVLAFLQKPSGGKPVNDWAAQGTIATGKDGRNGSWVFFTDLNGDGKSDYIYVESGSIYAWINKGASGGPWTWDPLGKINVNDVGATPENVQMVDIDGDGRADLLLVDNDTGAVTAWLNGGPFDMPDWQKVGIIATGASKTVNDIVILGDFTGNGFADYMLVGKDGKVTGLANFIQERAFIPRWAPKVTIAEGPEGATQQYVRLMDVNGDGKADYLLYDKNGGSKLWLNAGKGGKWQVGDGVFLADLNGDGVRDYIWSDGSQNILGYLGDGLASNNWQNEGQVKRTDQPWDLRHLHMAVITNSRRPDVVMVDNVQGACQWSQNLGRSDSGSYSWGAVGVLATGPKHTVIAAPYNWRWDSTRVRFADLTGDGLDDYLYINTNGAVLMWKNQGTIPPSWGNAQLIAAGPQKGVWGTEIQFGDTDGDGKMDYIHVNRITGAAEVWRNLGFREDGSIDWAPPTPWAESIGGGAAGYSIRVVDMTNDGRADIVSVDPHTGGLTLWENACPAPPPDPPKTTANPTTTVSSSTGTATPVTTADDDDNYAPEEFEPCDYTKAFDNLDDLNAAADGLRVECLAAYVMRTLITMLDTAYDNYTSVNDGYDEEFGYYVTYIQKLVPTVLDKSFMFDEASDTAYRTMPPPGLGMSYFDCQIDKSGSSTFPCTDVDLWHEDMSTDTTILTLRDEDGYNGALGNAGLAPDWVVLGDHEVDKSVVMPHAGRTYRYQFSGYPIENPDIVVPNPKDLITKGLGSIPELRESMQATYLEIVLGLYTGGTTMDAAEAYSTPVFMLMQAVDGMAQAKALGAQEEKEEEEEEKRRKNFIILIVSVVLMFVPVVGEEIALAAGLATLARTIAIAGELGNAALAIYDTVQDPEAAVVNILGMLIGVGSIAKVARTGKGIGDVAKLRRGMTATDVAGLGSVFKNSDDKLQNIVKVCRLP